MAKEEYKDKVTKWHHVWKSEDISRRDYLSVIIFNEIKSVLKNMKSIKAVEIGSGSGRISKMLSQSGADVTLIDMERDVIFRSRQQFLKENVCGKFIAGAFPEVPVKDKQFDVVWNAGVIEHFPESELVKALAEMARICKNDGVVITINPNKKSLLHNIGRRLLISRGLYPFMDEKPIATLRDIIDSLSSCQVCREYSSGFFVLFVGMFKRLALFPRLRTVSMGIFWALSDMMCILDKSIMREFIRTSDRLLSKVFGGYLLVTVFTCKHKYGG